MQLCEWANIKRVDSDLVGLYFKDFELCGNVLGWVPMTAKWSE